MEVKYFLKTIQKSKITIQDNEDFNNTHTRHVTTKKTSEVIKRTYPSHLKIFSGLRVKIELLNPWGTELLILTASSKV